MSRSWELWIDGPMARSGNYGYSLQEEGTKTKSSSEPRVDKRIRSMTGSRLQRRYTGTYEEIADVKRGHMDKNAFENIIAEFPPACDDLKPLARQLRRVLFPIRDEAIFTGTFQGLYSKRRDF